MSSKNVLACFKAYDVRGKIGEQLNEDISYRVGRATAQVLKAKSLVVGFDARESSKSLADAVTRGVCDTGAEILSIGLSGTEEMYAAVSEFNADAGIEITASHNPIDYNGMKIVKGGSQPLTSKEFSKIKRLAEENTFNPSYLCGSAIDKTLEAREAYIEKIFSFIDLQNLKPLKIVINSGNGVAGPVIDKLSRKLEERGAKTNFVYLHHTPNSLFPNGIPNPMLEENRKPTSETVIKEKADFGVAFDGDFDRCFFFDHRGDFIPGEYIVGVIAEIFLKKEDGATIVHDPRVIWNTRHVVNRWGGKAVSSRTGHAFVKTSMRNTKAIYGGEMSAHHYFRDFTYCDSGMIPWLVIWELLSKENISLADLISKSKKRFPSSGEINFSVINAENCIKEVHKFYDTSSQTPVEILELDGLSMSFKRWRFNLRKSNTEPLVRLNIETKGDKQLLQEKMNELKNIILKSSAN